MNTTRAPILSRAVGLTVFLVSRREPARAQGHFRMTSYPVDADLLTVLSARASRGEPGKRRREQAYGLFI